MLGRAVFVLCLLTAAAYACPSSHDADAQALAQRTSSDDSRGLIVAFALMGLCGFGFIVTRSNAVRRTFATSRRLAEIDLDVLRRVAKIQRDRTVWFAGACTVAVWVTARLPLVPVALMWAVTTQLVVLAIAMIAMCRLQLLISLRPQPDLRAYSHGHYLYAARDNRLVEWVGASPKLVALASALPIATAQVRANRASPE